MSILYVVIAAFFICDLLETDWANVPATDRAIQLALIAIGIFTCGWGVAFDLLG